MKVHVQLFCTPSIYACECCGSNLTKSFPTTDFGTQVYLDSIPINLYGDMLRCGTNPKFINWLASYRVYRESSSIDIICDVTNVAFESSYYIYLCDECCKRHFKHVREL